MPRFGLGDRDFGTRAVASAKLEIGKAGAVRTSACAAVGAINARIAALAKDFAQRGIKQGIPINSVLPGSVMMGSRRSMLEACARDLGLKLDKVKATPGFAADSGVSPDKTRRKRLNLLLSMPRLQLTGLQVRRCEWTAVRLRQCFDRSLHRTGVLFMKQILCPALIAVAAAVFPTSSIAQPAMSDSSTTTYHTVPVDGLNIFYREAGPKDAPTILLLHGYPSSSQMFATLIPLLADRYHLVAPDYPGFGKSDAPPASSFAYTFDHLAKVVEDFTQVVGLREYVLFQQDYGGPVGMRLAVAHPERVRAIIVQNAVSHEDGLGPAWEIRRAFWKDRAAYEDKIIPGFTSLEGCKARHLGSSPNVERYDPETWESEAALLARPGLRKIQSDLFFNYQTNVAAYPSWQAWLKHYHPPLLVLWGKYDPSFAPAEAHAYQRDVPNAEVHILDAGHFALDEKVDQAASLTRAFLAKHKI